VTLQKQAGSPLETLLTLPQQSAEGVVSSSSRNGKHSSIWLTMVSPSKCGQDSKETMEVFGNEHAGTATATTAAAAAVVVAVVATMSSAPAATNTT